MRRRKSVNGCLPLATLSIACLEARYFLLKLSSTKVARLHRACKEGFRTERSHMGILDQQPRTPRLLKVLENNSADGICSSHRRRFSNLRRLALPVSPKSTQRCPVQHRTNSNLLPIALSLIPQF
jgi:hypothetical protein